MSDGTSATSDQRPASSAGTTAAGPLPPPGPERTAALRAASAAQRDATRADLERLVRIPSVSAPAFDQAHVAASAEAVAGLLRDAGLPEVRIVTATGDGATSAPAVIARRPAPAGRPTVLLYAHHDVQPPGRPEDWASPAFEPAEREGRLFGRGAADDKAGVMVHVSALRTVLPLWGPEDGVGVTVFVEGEEEIGSPTFQAFLAEHRADLAADAIVVADSANWRTGVPAVTTTLRGLVDCDVRVDVLSHAVHSGVNGGPVVDALTSLCRLVATLHDENGDVAVRGLHTGVAADLPAGTELTEAQFRADAGVLPGVRLAGTGPLTSRLWTRPALSVIGLDATDVEHASNTLIPSARAKLSLRIAPGQEPATAMTALRRHLEANAPFGARVTVTAGEAGQAFAADTSSPAHDVARAAFAEAFGAEVVEIGMGGSIPFVADLAAVYPGAAILVTGVEDPDSRAHGADESLHLADFASACLGEVLLLDGLAATAPTTTSTAAQAPAPS